jgi:superfamily I DNA and/or RNA helicase
MVNYKYFIFFKRNLFFLLSEVGFLSDSRRINVAITRARRHLCIICNVQTVTHDPFIKRLIDYMIQNGQVHSAFEFIDGFYFFYLYFKFSFSFFRFRK